MIVFLEGGLGKMVSFTALLPDLARKHGELVIVSGWPEVFEGQTGVKRSLDPGAAYGYDEYVRKADGLMWPEPYRTMSYFGRRKTLIECWCEACGIPYRAEMKPIAPPKVERMPWRDIGKFILIQFTGGMMSPEKPMGQVRDYEKGQAVVDLIKKNRPDIQVINFAAPAQPHFNGEAAGPDGKPAQMHYLAAWAFLKHAEAFVGTDSSLHHMAATWGARGVVLWGGTDPKMLGYSDQVNVLGDCPLGDDQCMRPWTMPTLDALAGGRPWECPERKCMDIKPERVYAELEKLLGGKAA